MRLTNFATELDSSWPWKSTFTDANEYDLKQIILMKEKIDLFETGKLNLFDLVSDLNGLLNALKSVDESWKDNFRTVANTLELIHDSVEDGSISKWEGDFTEDLHNSISKLKDYILYKIENYLKIPDPNILNCATEAVL